jgi:hypothetical protein
MNFTGTASDNISGISAMRLVSHNLTAQRSVASESFDEQIPVSSDCLCVLAGYHYVQFHKQNPV